MVWEKSGPWRTIVVYRKAPRSFLGMHSNDILEQSISCKVPDDKLAELKRFDARIKFDKPSGELSSLSESEKFNYLILNLADEIVADKWSADEARDFYRKTVRLSESGKSSAYMTGFVFPLDKEDNLWRR